MNTKLAPFIVIAALIATHGIAHPGGLDSRGGHNDRKNGGYHYHRKAVEPPPAQRGPEADAAQASKQKEYWITNSSGVRHNSNCRYFQNSKGRKGGKDEGRACKICGG